MNFVLGWKEYKIRKRLDQEEKKGEGKGEEGVSEETEAHHLKARTTDN
jgi:hypothetical protein